VIKEFSEIGKTEKRQAKSAMNAYHKKTFLCKAARNDDINGY